jgi:hypothetical protein
MSFLNIFFSPATEFQTPQVKVTSEMNPNEIQIAKKINSLVSNEMKVSHRPHSLEEKEALCNLIVKLTQENLRKDAEIRRLKK